jgi:hypothetical protein
MVPSMSSSSSRFADVMQNWCPANTRAINVFPGHDYPHKISTTVQTSRCIFRFFPVETTHNFTDVRVSMTTKIILARICSHMCLNGGSHLFVGCSFMITHHYNLKVFPCLYIYIQIPSHHPNESFDDTLNKAKLGYVRRFYGVSRSCCLYQHLFGIGYDESLKQVSYIFYNGLYTLCYCSVMDCLSRTRRTLRRYFAGSDLLGVRSPAAYLNFYKPPDRIMCCSDRLSISGHNKLYLFRRNTGHSGDESLMCQVFLYIQSS